ncbi:NAD/NADP octopine/nopaline dehydrogenase family protein [Haloimpatiens sp. FM7315]|uniref:NAD/NADP octopine/nopaline dehydrogenase family protein n=1 Tax=Haloimpatiens sp. FM7315 TaxID=3298609 RepID=UPI00370AE1FE
MKLIENYWRSINNKIRICILGGGNIGTLLLGHIGKQNNIEVNLYTSKPDKWNNEIEIYDINNVVKCRGQVNGISDKPEEVLKDSDIIISTLPSHIFPNVLRKISPFIKDKAWIGVMPGSGGVEFLCKDLIRKGCTLFGFQRVFGISRVKEYGKSVFDLGRKDELFIASIPIEKTVKVCMVMQSILNIKCRPLKNFLNVTLTPSNPILHTTRLYSMFHSYKKGMSWNSKINFYEDWTDKSSDILIACDDELQKMCHRINGLDLRGVRSLKNHYESETSEKMTQKISSILAFKGIKTPMKKTKDGYIPDFKSRYFLEDFPYGLCIIKGFCDILGLDTPNIDKVLKWFEKIAGVEYYIDGTFKGKDLEELPLPKNYGVNSIEDIVNYYR